ncbi:hypothetical protein JDV02_003116 [Purpureocillium takamizusanense]|uniref:Chitinase n=1 Tax=Purpureocillium takamizusanense TaxID=2060973 RepID=A0A9Q8QDF0_9HYPO|nr:uncharacterized protein JDV02_003116 [Purpureocillium takamizusanense]UNI16702.1 hypothetical protein JDV02_003116 [Purpureocillium takamizusanense]
MRRVWPREKVERFEEVIHIETNSESICIGRAGGDNHAELEGIEYCGTHGGKLHLFITLAPVASALLGGANLSGFSYEVLENKIGSDISFYNVQFYNGFGSMSNVQDYKTIAAKVDHSKVVAGLLTSQTKGTGWLPFAEMSRTIHSLRDEYVRFGGVAGWEYSDSQPGGQARPWEWVQSMTTLLRPHGVGMV